jgi:hypothetical protein
MPNPLSCKGFRLAPGEAQPPPLLPFSDTRRHPGKKIGASRSASQNRVLTPKTTTGILSRT